MSEPNIEPTGDDVADGTQLATYYEAVVEAVAQGELEQGDAGVPDDGTEEWYGEE